MALTDEDKKRLSKEDQRRIEEATARWEQADAAGDEAGKKAAADEAKKIREQAGYYTDSYGRYAGEWGEQEEQLFLDGFEDKDSSAQNGQQAVISAERPAPPRSYDGMYSVEGGSGKSFIYDPVEKTIEVFRPDGSHDIIKKDNESYGITYQAMEADTGYDFSKAEPDWELENRRAYWDAKEELDAKKDKKVEDIMAEVEALYLKSQEKERAAESKTTAQNRNLYDGYMQEIDPYGEFAEKIAKKGLTKSGYPQYDYEGFKKAFEAQAGDNMQNLRQLKAEIRAALQLAIATENEKLEEALLNYRTNLAKLEQEYLGQSSMGAETVRAEEVAPLSASSEQEGFETAGSDIAEKRNGIISFAKALPNTDMRPWQEEIRNLDEFPNDGEWTNLLLRGAAADDSGIELQKMSAPISHTANAEVKLNSETDVVELFESMGYVVEEVQHGKSRMKALQIKDETGKIVLRLYPYSDIREQNGKYVFTESALKDMNIIEILNTSPYKIQQVLDFKDNVINNGAKVTTEDIAELYENLLPYRENAHVRQSLAELKQNSSFLSAYLEYEQQLIDEWRASVKDKYRDITLKGYDILDYLQDNIGIMNPLIKSIQWNISEKRTEENYNYNNSQDEITTIIYDQKAADIANYKYGNSTMKTAGCGIIAAFNAMHILKDSPDMPDMIRYFEQNGAVLNGRWGTDPMAVKSYLEEAGYTVESISDNFDEALTNNNVIILSYWKNADNILQGMHFVTINRGENGEILVYNYASQDAPREFKTIEGFLSGAEEYLVLNRENSPRALVSAFVVSK